MFLSAAMLTGVATGGGLAVVMGNGSVLHYLKKERGMLLPPNDADCSVVRIHKSNRSLLVEWLPETFSQFIRTHGLEIVILRDSNLH